MCKKYCKVCKYFIICTDVYFNNISLDKKGRFSFPAKYREDLSFSSKIILTKDPQYPALKVYLKDDWDKISAKLTALQGLDPVVRNLQWTILGNASVCEFDPTGRMHVLIPSDLKEYANILDKNRICLVGMGNKFEIWDLENWEMRQTGGVLATEILEVVLPESVKDMSF